MPQHSTHKIFIYEFQILVFPDRIVDCRIAKMEV